ncbi:MAG TPA: hypothetical protein PLC04_02090 [Candidatus Kapabacteria bacterium]|jgi:hypothetical protein|nr:hypothetical protein [Candidatus Kapabacteria bacterium]HOV91856.1 hypothetical protein [Candidatus Kapabacteria bacterium]
MKKYSKIGIFLCMSVLLTSCYTQTVSDFSQFTVQIPINFYDKSTDRKVPDVGLNFSNLYQYDEYTSNKDRIDRAEVYQFSIWVDSLVLPGNPPKPFVPNVDEIIFEHVRYTIVFAKPKIPGNEQSLNADDFEIDNTIQPFTLADFYNVSVSDYYKNPKHIYSVPQEEAIVISDLLKTRPYFYVLAEYSKYLNQPADTIVFPYSEYHGDLVVRLKIKL